MLAPAKASWNGQSNDALINKKYECGFSGYGFAFIALSACLWPLIEKLLVHV